MKKFVLGLILSALVASSSFAKGNFEKLSSKCVYFIYKVQIRTDINRDFYSKALFCPELVKEPHYSGDFNLQKAKALFTGYDLPKQYYHGNPAGEFTYTQVKNEKGSAAFDGFDLYFFGSTYHIELPFSNNRDSSFKFDEKAKYVYAGTFVYDFVDGVYIPKLVKVVDEYDAAKVWLNEMEGADVELCRATIE